MKSYIFISGLYRLSCGALILAINWIMAIQSPSFASLALLVALTFLPAVFVPLVWKKPLGGQKTTAYALMCCGILSFCLYYFNDHNIIVLLNTSLWFFFFILESSWESWFASLSKSYTPQRIDKYSSLSMSVNQASLMIGPIFAAFVFKDTPKEIIFWCGILFVLSGLWVKIKTQAEIIHKATQEQTAQIPLKLNIIFGCLVLIWPTLALFNFMLPAQIAYSEGEMTEVGILDAAMGLGMILSSFLLSLKNAKKIFIHYYLSVGIIILGIVCWFFAQNILLKILSLLCLGISFNLIRISIRSFLAQEYDSQNVGKIVSYANSFSFFVIIVLFSLFYDALSINWLLPFILTLLLCIMFSVAIKNK